MRPEGVYRMTIDISLRNRYTGKEVAFVQFSYANKGTRVIWKRAFHKIPGFGKMNKRISLSRVVGGILRDVSSYLKKKKIREQGLMTLRWVFVSPLLELGDVVRCPGYVGEHVMTRGQVRAMWDHLVGLNPYLEYKRPQLVHLEKEWTRLGRAGVCVLSY